MQTHRRYPLVAAIVSDQHREENITQTHAPKRRWVVWSQQKRRESLSKYSESGAGTCEQRNLEQQCTQANTNTAIQCRKQPHLTGLSCVLELVMKRPVPTLGAAGTSVGPVMDCEDGRVWFCTSTTNGDAED